MLCGSQKRKPPPAEAMFWSFSDGLNAGPRWMYQVCAPST